MKKNLYQVLKAVESGEMTAIKAHKIIAEELSEFNKYLARNVDLDSLMFELSDFVDINLG